MEPKQLFCLFGITFPSKQIVGGSHSVCILTVFYLFCSENKLSAEGTQQNLRVWVTFYFRGKKRRLSYGLIIFVMKR